ncbi:MAG: prepilin-type N-terminal cleavage/methylation domain-containing protein [Gallionella sp.]|jgi:general secretion pathway protein G
MKHSSKFPVSGLTANSKRQTVSQQSSILNPQSSRGFTLIELVVVTTIIVVLVGVFLNRVMFYQEHAEKTAMEEVAEVIQSALTMQYGQILTRGSLSDLPALVRDNPMNWLQKKPRNYAGEFYDPTPLTVESGNWVFDLKSRDLIYVVRNDNYFTPGKDGKKWIRFHTATHYESSRLPSLQAVPPVLTGVMFEPAEPYHWFD